MFRFFNLLASRRHLSAYVKTRWVKTCLPFQNSSNASHTVILLDWTLRKWALSSFAFQSFYGFIGTRNTKKSSIPVKDSWWPHQQGKVIPAHSKKCQNGSFNTCMNFELFFGQMSFWSTLKVPFCDFIQNLSKYLSKLINGIISQIPQRNLKIIFV